MQASYRVPIGLSRYLASDFAVVDSAPVCWHSCLDATASNTPQIPPKGDRERSVDVAFVAVAAMRMFECIDQVEASIGGVIEFVREVVEVIIG